MKIVSEISERGVTERRLDLFLEHQQHPVPGVLWTPAEGRAMGLVLIGHGAGFDKRTPYIVSLARRLVRHHGIAAVAIDGPEHGERVQLGQMWWSEEVTNVTIAEWKATLAACHARDEIGDVPTGYWGFSMGTIFGLPFVASEPSLRVAVLGLMGLTGPTQDRIEQDAKSLRADLPLLFVLQRNDELFPLRSGMALFDAFGTADKRLHLNMGAHGAVPLEEFDLTEAFLAKHLAEPDAR